MLMTSRKKVVGESSGKMIVQKRLVGPAPSIAAASMNLAQQAKQVASTVEVFKLDD